MPNPDHEIVLYAKTPQTIVKRGKKDGVSY